MSQPEEISPKLFVSYSWSSPDHEQWVLDLCTELRQQGIDVILDKWDLREGHDAHAFMERMVNDVQIGKVALICDEQYATKANGRDGGVGTEAQIISPELYSNQEQSKFVAVVVERDSDGKAYLPTYYKSRIYIDLSDPAEYGENIERLVRWVFDKPVYEKPVLGKPPAYVSGESPSVVLTTSAKSKRTTRAVKDDKPHALAAAREYFESLTQELEKLRLPSDADPFDDAVVQSIEEFLPYRNEAIEVLMSVASHEDEMESGHLIHRFLEGLIPYLERSESVTSYREWDFDNFKFIVHELFLYAIASLLRYEKFGAAGYLLTQEYYVPGRSEFGSNAMVSYIVFRAYMQSLEHRNERLGLRKLSLRAQLLKERVAGVGLEFRHLMQADFVVFLRDRLDRPEDQWYWWPETLIYAGRSRGPFEIFARSRSLAYFENLKRLLGIDDPASLQMLAMHLDEDRSRKPRWQSETISVVELSGANEIGVKA